MRGETILIVDDEKLIRWSLTQELAKEGYGMLEAATVEEAIARFSEQQADLIVLDQRLPDGTGIELLERFQNEKTEVPVIMLTAVDRSDVAVQAMKLGAFDYVTKPVNLDELKIVIQKALEATHLKRELARLRQEQTRFFGSTEIIGSSPLIRKVLDFIGKVAQSSTTTVLITGESGTGKELVARALHFMSSRKDKPFVTVNCSALPEQLLESELFGHEKGAFTDAHIQKKGLFELADKGTIFLDEIGDMSPLLQVKLLRVLEDKSFRRVGGANDITVDVRVIAATNQPLEQRIEEGKFRTDLYYRLNVASVHVAPLRERGDDILLLAQHFLNHFNSLFRKKFKGLSKEVQDLFRRYSWPGNVRELKNILERATLLNETEFILPEHVQLGQQSRSLQPPLRSLEPLSLDELEKQAIIQALEKAGHNKSQAARFLSISRDTLRYRMKKYGLMRRAG